MALGVTPSPVDKSNEFYVSNYNSLRKQASESKYYKWIEKHIGFVWLITNKQTGQKKLSP